MGRNARLRAVRRDATKNPDVSVETRRTEAEVMRALGERMADVETRLDFEELISFSPHPDAMRRLCTPMLRPNLPCCPSVVLGLEEHAPGCPDRAVKLYPPGAEQVYAIGGRRGGKRMLP